MTLPCQIHRKASPSRADIHVGVTRRGGGGGTSGPSFPRPRSPHSLLPSFCSGDHPTVGFCRLQTTRTYTITSNVEVCFLMPRRFLP